MTIPMPRDGIHEHHTDRPDVSIIHFLVTEARRNGTPVPDTVIGKIKAELYRGLWIVRCQGAGCSGAVAVTSTNPVHMCPDCGFGWNEVLFPGNKDKIEAEVLKRPTVGRGLIYANWRPEARNGKGESLAELRKQTAKILEDAGG